MTMDEKVLPRTRKFNPVGFCLTGIRVWQWSSSFFVWASFSLLYDHIQRNGLGENNQMKGVQLLGLASLVYSTFIILCVHIFKTLGLRSWRFFAIVSLPGDLTVMGVCLAKITILSYSGLPADCHGLTSDDYEGSDLLRQPADGYNTIRFGSWSMKMSGELDSLCTFPRTVYGLSVVAIFTYTFSLLLNVLYIQQQKTQAFDSEKTGGQPSIHSPRPTLRYVGGHVASSMHAPSILDLDDEGSRPPSPHTSFSRSSSPRQGSLRSNRSSRTASTSSQTSGWGAVTLVSRASDTESVISGTSMISGTSIPPRPLPGCSAPSPPQRRWSTSTSSSYNANAFIVTDGFSPRPDMGLPAPLVGPVVMGEPPAYSSRPGSLYNEPMKYDAALGMPGTRKP